MDRKLGGVEYKETESVEIGDDVYDKVEEPECKTCLFGFPDGNNVECRRYPGKLVRGQYDTWREFPPMYSYDCCGEYYKRPDGVNPGVIPWETLLKSRQ